ncbi:hypothetical protein PRBEI_2001878200 [Prionailurus iriomotensis]
MEEQPKEGEGCLCLPRGTEIFADAKMYPPQGCAMVEDCYDAVSRGPATGAFLLQIMKPPEVIPLVQNPRHFFAGCCQPSAHRLLSGQAIETGVQQAPRMSPGNAPS